MAPCIQHVDDKVFSATGPPKALMQSIGPQFSFLKLLLLVRSGFDACMAGINQVYTPWIFEPPVSITCPQRFYQIKFWEPDWMVQPQSMTWKTLRGRQALFGEKESTRFVPLTAS